MSIQKIYARFLTRFAEKLRKDSSDCKGMSKILHAAKMDGSDLVISVTIDGQYFSALITGGTPPTRDFLEGMANFFAGYGLNLAYCADVADQACIGYDKEMWPEMVPDKA